MGLSASKRVSRSLRDSPEFNSACEKVFEDLLALTQHAFPGIFPYQLSEAATRLHISLSSSLSSTSNPLIKKWLPSPPSQADVDRAYLRLASSSGGEHRPPQTLGADEFKVFSVELFADAVVDSASREVIVKVPIGVAGIAGVGLATRSGKDLIGTAIGIYALGVATSVYVSLILSS